MKPMAERFWELVAKGPNCWEWLGYKSKQGYGQFGTTPRSLGSHSYVIAKAHRVAYELLVGAIPEGMTLDHLCRNRGCVNPTHLEVVTAKENVLRGTGITAIAARKTHCKNGHAFTTENTYERKDVKGRKCRLCMKAQMERFRATRCA